MVAQHTPYGSALVWNRIERIARKSDQSEKGMPASLQNAWALAHSGTGRAVTSSGVEPVEAEEWVFDGQNLDLAEARLAGVAA